MRGSRWQAYSRALLVMGSIASAGACHPTDPPRSKPETSADPAVNEPVWRPVRPRGARDRSWEPRAGSASLDPGSKAHADEPQQDAAVVASAAAAVDAEPPRVAIEGGELEGAPLPGGVRRFLGVPYAEPPIGALRFEPPKAAAPWPGRRSANSFGPRCAQLASPLWQTAASSDEDCLYLNVWAPAQPNAPVLVVVHGAEGGSGAGGSASEPAAFGDDGLSYDGELLARDHGLLVVTFNYRLGALGFLAHRALAGENWQLGNQALWDQRLALSWVQRNIAAFGGDPQRVTLLGQAGGARDVCLHMTSPESRGSFLRAIGQSAGCTTLQLTGEQAMAQADAFANRLGCSGEGALECLRSRPVEALLAAAAESAPFGPIVDGRFLPDQPRAVFSAGDSAPVPYLMGSNADEGTLLLQGEPEVVDAEQLKAAITRHFSTPAARIAQRYPISEFSASAKPFRAALARILGDAAFVCSVADSASLAAAAGASVYLYNFAVPMTVAGVDLGAAHGGELGFVFGTASAIGASKERVRSLIQSYWAEFARSGDPNGEGRPNWPAYEEAAAPRLNFSSTPAVIHNFRRDECDFWRSTYANSFAAAGALEQ